MWFVLWDKSIGFDLIPSLIKAFIEHQIWSHRMAAKSGNWFFSSVFNTWSLEEEYNHTLIQSSMGINFLVAKFRGHCRVAPNYSSKWALKEYMLMGTSVLQRGTRDIRYAEVLVDGDFHLKGFPRLFSKEGIWAFHLLLWSFLHSP